MLRIGKLCFEVNKIDKQKSPCGGRRCPTCDRCRDWKLIDGGNPHLYFNWKRVSDPDSTCHYSHIHHAFSVLSWNCRCKE